VKIGDRNGDKHFYRPLELEVLCVDDGEGYPCSFCRRDGEILRIGCHIWQVQASQREGC
jgi:hypothetical protein